MKQPTLYKAPTCASGKCKSKAAPSKRKNVKPDYDWSKMTRVGNQTERASLDQQTRYGMSKKKTKK